MIKMISGFVALLLFLDSQAFARPIGTHHGGICHITDSSGMSGEVSCGSGPSQAQCTADGACSFKISKQNWNRPDHNPVSQGKEWKLTPEVKG